MKLVSSSSSSSSSPLSRDPSTQLVRDFETDLREDESDQILVIAAIAYGDETYIPGMPRNVGNCALGIGVSTTNPQIQVPNYNLKRMDQLLPRFNSALCEPFASSIRSYCDYGDEQCCSPCPPDGNAAHHHYIWKYNQDVVDFIKHRLATIGQ